MPSCCNNTNVGISLVILSKSRYAPKCLRMLKSCDATSVPKPNMYVPECLINTNHGPVTPPIVDFDVSWCSVDSLIVHGNVTEPSANPVLAALGSIAGKSSHC